MNSVDANPDNIPILGEYSFIYWTNVQSVDSLPELERTLEEIRSAAADGRNGTSPLNSSVFEVEADMIYKIPLL
jgi:hypothetical protein